MKTLGAATWAWWCMMMMVVVFMAASVLGYSNVVFDVAKAAENNNPAGYSEFLKKLRDQVASPTRVCELQTTQSSPKKGSEYITAELKVSNTESVTLGISVIDLYVWGYQDKFDGNLRARFVKDAPKDVQDNLFKGAKKETTPFKGTYHSLEKFAKEDRTKLQLNFKILHKNIINVYGKTEKQLNEKGTEAKYFLIAAQMVPEAVRFKLMEDSILKDDNQKSTVSLRVAFQNEWDKISKSITAAHPTCVKLNPSRKIDGQEFSTVDKIKGKMGLLKVQKKSTMDKL